MRQPTLFVTAASPSLAPFAKKRFDENFSYAVNVTPSHTKPAVNAKLVPINAVITVTNTIQIATVAPFPPLLSALHATNPGCLSLLDIPVNIGISTVY
jgi:hypothetical protein